MMKSKNVCAFSAAILGHLVILSHGQALPEPAGGRHAPGELIIQFHADVTDAQIADVFRVGELKLMKHVQTPAMRSQGRIGLTHVATSRPLQNAIDELNNLPGVDFAELNGIATPDHEANDPFYLDGSLWGMYSDDLPSAIGPLGTSNAYGSQAEKLWAAGYVGSTDIFVGMIDTGLQHDHPDLAPNVWTNPDESAGDNVDNDGNGYVDDIHGWNACDNNGVTFTLTDDDGHGTFTSGVVGAAGNDGVGVAGMNWNIRLISGKFLGAASGTLLDAIEAIDYLIALKTSKNLNIVAFNCSWSYGGISLALQDALVRAAQAGILTICSASNQGNDNDILPRSPASLDTTAGAGFNAVVCVAAIDRVGAKASFSNYGRHSVHLAAPGVEVISTVPVGEPPNGTASGYELGSGTSASAPHVTGAVALYASVFPNATAAQIRAQLLTAGVVSTPSVDTLTLTGGRLDAYAMVTQPGGTTTVPTAPSGLTGTVPKGAAKGTVNLAWSDRSTDEKGFAIERKLSTSSTWQVIATVGPNTSSHSNTGLASRNTYNYRVRAFNVGGSSAYSNTVTVTVK